MYRRFYKERLLKENSGEVIIVGNFGGEVEGGYDILRERWALKLQNSYLIQ